MKQPSINVNANAKTLIQDIQTIILANNDYLMTKNAKAIILNGAKCLLDDNEKIFCLTYTNSKFSKEEYRKTAKEKKLTVIEFPKANNYKYLIQAEINSELNKLISGTESISNEVYFTVFDDDGEQVTLEDETTTIKVALSEEIDQNQYIYYYDRGIDIYDPIGDAFTKVCYTNTLLKYDLSQNFRKNELFAKKAIEPNGKNCKYNGLDLYYNQIVLSCTTSSTLTSYSIVDANILAPISGRNNIPTFCISEVSNIGSNAGFWIFTIIIFVFIIVCLVIYAQNYYYKKKGILIDPKKEPEIIELQIRDDSIPLNEINNSASIHENRFIDNNNLNDNNNNNENENENDNTLKNKRKSKDFSNDNHNKHKHQKFNSDDFYNLLYHNMLNYHPLTFVCQESSALNPLPYKMLLFVFNLCTQFGFLAVLNTESMIDKRRTRRERDYFDYPIKYDFHILILSLLCSISCTMIIKIIVLITLHEKKTLDSKLYAQKNEEAKQEKLEMFAKDMRFKRMSAMTIMAGVCIFFYIYAIGFCGIYINTQITWLYSCLWILFFNWVIFAPFTVLVMTGTQYYYHWKDCDYYMKNIFPF